MTYSEQIKIARDKLLLTQDEFANEIGVNAVTVCRWETGKCEPTIKTKKVLKTFFEKNGLIFEEKNV